MKDLKKKLKVPSYVTDIIDNCNGIIVPESKEELIKLSLGNDENNDIFNVEYDVEGYGKVTEAYVTRCKNGVVVNYNEDYMRRRDPDSTIIGDDKDTDKSTYAEIYNKDFNELRNLTFDWLKTQKLIVLPFKAGGLEYGYDALILAPDNAGCFACALEIGRASCRERV